MSSSKQRTKARSLKKTQETKLLLRQALGLNSQERTVLLEQIDDTDIRSQVETLLADESQMQAFLAQNKTGDTTTAHTDELIEPGSLINRIRIIKALGQGGMGSVYLGFDEKLERQVAVKSIRPEHLKNPATQQRFVREAQIMSKINHPSICQLYDYLETPDGDFLVLEYIKGKPLYKVPMNDEEKLQAMAELAAALAVAHEHGIVHRDLKPDNIMVTEQGQLKVLDFGIAQSLSKPKVIGDGEAKTMDSALTQQGSLVGTIRYMSPEQAQGKNIDTASDLYALGVIAQEVFSHQAAYQVMETEQLLADVQQGKRSDMANVPDTICDLIENLTQLNPEDRPTALAAEQQFKAILNAPKRKQKRIIKYSIITIGVMLLMLVGWQWQQFGQQQVISKQIKSYETQINDLVKQAEQIYVLPIHPVDKEIGLIMDQGEALFGKIEYDELLTEVDKRRLQGIIVLKGELYEDAIPLLLAGQAESHYLAYAWSNTYIVKASIHAEKYGFEQTMNDAALRAKYLTPALKYIDQAHTETGEINLLFQAFKLSQTESLEAGLQAIDQLLAEEHWNKEAVNLKALILSAAMSNAQERGDWELGKEYALQTAATYQLSTQMARSYPYTYGSLCLTYLQLMADGIQRSGQQVETFTEQAVLACENALIIQPENKYPMRLLARVYMMKAQWEVDLGVNADDSLKMAKSWNQQASTLEDLFSSSWAKASMLSIEAKQMMFNGKTALPVIEQALSLFGHMLKVESEYQPYIVSDMLYVLAQQALELIRQNQDPTATVDRAQNLFDQTMLTPDLLASEQWALINNMAEVYWLALNYQFNQGQNILSQGEKLIAFLSPDDYLLKDDPLQLTSLANTHLLMAEYLRRQQQPLNDHLSLAARYLDEALAINPNNHHSLTSQATLVAMQNYFTDQDYSQANTLFEQVNAINPTNPYTQLAWAKSLLLQAQSMVTAESQKQTIELGLEKINYALSVDAQNPFFITAKQELLEAAETP